MKRIIILICFIFAIFLSCQKKHDEKIINKDMSNIITTENMPKIKERETYKVERIKSLLEKGIETKDEYWSGQTALILASEYGYSGIIKSLIEAGADVNAKDTHVKTALMYASQYCRTKTVKLLIDAGADINLKDMEGYTALIYASGLWFPEEIRKVLIDKNNSSYTILMLDPDRSYIETVRLLIDAGADVNAKNSRGYTALMNASYNVYTKEAVKLLIDAGSDINAKDNEGYTALMKASQQEDTAESVKLLIDAGADVNTKNNYGYTALMYAASSDSYYSAEREKLLIEAGADINAKDDEGYTALMYASGLLYPKETLKALIATGERLKAENNYTNTSLYTKETVKVLIDAKADLNIKNNEGKTALDYAKENGNKEIIDILIQSGAK